jgi:hypothetical protein
MRSKFASVLLVALVLADLCMVGVVYAIFHRAEWHVHLVRFVHQVWIGFLGLEGSSSNGFLSGLLVAILEVIVVLLVVGYLHGVSAMKEHWVQDAGIGLFVLLALTILVYGSQIAWEVASTGYQDHHSLHDTNDALRAANEKLSAENTQMVDPKGMQQRISVLQDEVKTLNGYLRGPIETVTFPLRSMVGPFESEQVTLRDGHRGYLYYVIGITKNRIVPVEATLTCDHDMFVMFGAVHIGGKSVTGHQQPFKPTDSTNIAPGSYYRSGMIAADTPSWTIDRPLGLEIFSPSEQINCSIQESFQ